MTCRELVESLTDYRDGRLSAAERRGFEGHLNGCPDCVAYLETYRQAVRLGREAGTEGGAGADDVPEEFVRAVMAAWRR